MSSSSRKSSAALADALFACKSAAPPPPSAAKLDSLFASKPQVAAAAGGTDLRNDVLGSLTAQPRAAPQASRLGLPKDAPVQLSVSSNNAAQADLRVGEIHHDLHQLVFMVHGIGQHDDFVDGQFVSWDGTDGNLTGGNFEFRELLESLLSGRLREVPLFLSVLSVEWHAQLHRPEVDALISACSPEGVPELRGFVKDNIMDILYYSSAANSQRIVDAVAGQLNAKYRAFVAEHPGWCGRVNLLAHSLGSVIVLDMLTHAGTSFQSVYYPVHQDGQSGRLGGGIAGHQRLHCPHLKAWGWSPDS